MANAGPTDGFFNRMFGPKKRTTDIYLPNKKEQRAAEIEKEAKEFGNYGPKKKTAPTEAKSGGIFNKISEAKKKVNPFDRYAKAISGKSN